MDTQNTPSAHESLLSRTKKLLRESGIRAKKGLGQNFLVSDEVLEKILDAADLKPSDTVIEVGPGLGLMTAELAKRAGWVIAIELDEHLADMLKQNMPENVVVIKRDVLGTDPAALLESGALKIPELLKQYKVVANLPYYITSAVLRHFLEASIKPESIVVMVQKEVAEAITAKPGDQSVLSVSVQFYGKPEIIAIVPATAFYPAPDVDSALVKIDVYERPPVDVDDPDRFFKLVKAGFSAARKQAANAFSKGLGLEKAEVTSWLQNAGIDPTRRAETFTLEEWGRLFNSFLAMEK
ncbi:MAG TPA: 16S rRNA (adenine(1518)-N(6)/adenine(1519)-N(6))-dimethyltransferase RsmA [Dehalococcoidales bacterium]|nr:16S rRNA (adenine(1518)-N(6)/adenine(1519)-N(6))-dimethyltransferase RsmA [Dehalococcoidales bacterium]